MLETVLEMTKTKWIWKHKQYKNEKNMALKAAQKKKIVEKISNEQENLIE